jgi:hypothetical protein
MVWLRKDFKKGNIEPWQSKKMTDLALLITQVLLASITLVGDAPEKSLYKVPYYDFISAITVVAARQLLCQSYWMSGA